MIVMNSCRNLKVHSRNTNPSGGPRSTGATREHVRPDPAFSRPPAPWSSGYAVWYAGTVTARRLTGTSERADRLKL